MTQDPPAVHLLEGDALNVEEDMDLIPSIKFLAHNKGLRLLRVVRSGRVTIPSLQAMLQISEVTDTLFSMIGVCWNFQCEYAPQYPLNSDTVAQHITPEVFFNFLGLRT